MGVGVKECVCKDWWDLQLEGMGRSAVEANAYVVVKECCSSRDRATYSDGKV